MVCFINLRKVYDTVNRPALLGVLQRHIRIPGKLQRLIRDLHTGTRSSIRCGEVSKSFDVKSSVRQGCTLALALFNKFLDHMICIALKHMVQVQVQGQSVEAAVESSEQVCAYGR